MGALCLDVAVCGCGPAGLTAALLLARDGHRVSLFERFESPQPVGSGLILQPTGLAVLQDLGLLDDMLARGARIDRLYGRVVPSQRVVLDVRYAALGAGWQGLAVHRSALFDVLHAKVKSSNISVVCSTAVRGIRYDARGVSPSAESDRSLGCFDLVVDAMGANSPITRGIVQRRSLPYGALWTTVPWPAQGEFRDNALEQRYRGASRMAGVLPIGRLTAKDPPQAAFFWSLRRDQLHGWQAADLRVWKSEVTQLWPEIHALIDGVEREQLTFARYDHFTRAQPIAERMAHIGDSARATSPQLGQGANMALLDALALAVALKESRSLDAGLSAYARMRRQHTRLFQWASAAFTPFYQSDSRTLPWIRDWLAAPLSRAPILSGLLARLVTGTLAPPLGRDGRFQPLRLNSTEPR